VAAVSTSFPPGYTARGYAGASDHAGMAAVLTAFHMIDEGGELVTTEQIAVTYEHIPADEKAKYVVVIEHERDGMVAYGRTGADETPECRTQYWIAAVRPEHLTQPLFMAMVAWLEARALERAQADPVPGQVFRCWQPHPGPGLEPGDVPAGWLQQLGYRAVRFGASMVRPNLDDIPDLPLPDGVEVRPVRPEQLRTIWEAHVEGFAGGFGEQEATEADWEQFRDDPIADPSMWKVAWSGDDVVGQVRSFVNHEENQAEGRLRGYTEFISTHADWRGRGLASALLAASLRELRDRGMTEAALGVDTENPANALGIYSRLGFQLVSYEAVMDRLVPLD
jgi:mycothiol synthase